MSCVLVIDDEEGTRHMLRAALERAGFSVVTAINGLDGMKRFHESTIDLVIADLIMPEMDGIETILSMLCERPEAKIIAISGGGGIQDPSLLSMAHGLGANDVLAKPIDPDVLVDRAKRCLSLQ